MSSGYGYRLVKHPLPACDVRMICQRQKHRVRVDAHGRITLFNHGPDTAVYEDMAGALGAAPCKCRRFLQAVREWAPDVPTQDLPDELRRVIKAAQMRRQVNIDRRCHFKVPDPLLLERTVRSAKQLGGMICRLVKQAGYRVGNSGRHDGRDVASFLTHRAYESVPMPPGDKPVTSCGEGVPANVSICIRNQRIVNNCRDDILFVYVVDPVRWLRLIRDRGLGIVRVARSKKRVIVLDVVESDWHPQPDGYRIVVAGYEKNWGIIPTYAVLKNGPRGPQVDKWFHGFNNQTELRRAREYLDLCWRTRPLKAVRACAT